MLVNVAVWYQSIFWDLCGIAQPGRLGMLHIGIRDINNEEF
jgi:hypothetical protein